VHSRNCRCGFGRGEPLVLKEDCAHCRRRREALERKHAFYVIIKRLKSYKYGEAMLSPLSPEGWCYGAVDHGTVIELQARAGEAGRKVLGVFMEPYSRTDDAIQELRFAELVKAACEKQIADAGTVGAG
jgi:hypothetical protein